MTLGGAAKRYYHGEVTERGNFNSSRDNDIVVPKRLYEARIMGAEAMGKNTGRDDGRTSLHRSKELPKEEKNSEPRSINLDGGMNLDTDMTIVKSAPLAPSPQNGAPDTPLSTLPQIQEEQGNDKVDSQPPNTNRSDLVLVPVLSESSYTPDIRETQDSQRFSAEELWPSVADRKSVV